VFTVATDEQIYEHNEEHEEQGDTDELQEQDQNPVPRVKGHSEILRDSTTLDSTTTTEYVYDGIGLYQCTHDFRHEFEHDFSDCRPNASPDNLYVDANFPMQVAVLNRPNMKWKRPHVSDVLGELRVFTV
jgi:hypothetical protein